MLDVLRFWLDLGIDGFRLDAVPYLFERDGTNCENLPETHEYLKRVRAEIDAAYPDRVLLAEANQWPADVVDYFGDGDECHMAFQFPVMPRLFMASGARTRRPIVDILEQTPPIPENAQWGLFLRNHDELTLEMVTDEERDYMYAEYATDPRMKLNLGIRRRLAPLLDNGRDEVELMTAILFSLPGSPVLYYGDEIGMGDNIYLGDRDGVRTPMQWTGDRNGGFSRADFARLYLPPLMDPVYGYQAVNVEAQLRTPTSLLRWLHRFIALRKEHPVFALGSYEPLRPENHADPRAHPPLRGRHRALRPQPRALGAGRRARPVALPGARARGDARAHRVPADRRAAVPAHLRGARLLLVPAPEPRVSRQPGRLALVPEGELLDFVRASALVRREGPGGGRRHACSTRCALREDGPRLGDALVEIRYGSGAHEVYQLLIGGGRARPADRHGRLGAPGRRGDRRRRARARAAAPDARRGNDRRRGGDARVPCRGRPARRSSRRSGAAAARASSSRTRRSSWPSG